MTDADAELIVRRPALDFDDARAKAAVAKRLFGADSQTRIDRFPVGARLGSGTFGVVYDAYDPRLERRVALKVMRLEDARDAEDEETLLGEARAAARLEHPAIVSVFDAGIDGDQLWIAMEQVEGGSLRAFFEEQPRAWPTLVEIFAQVAEGLQAAHEAGLLHRDLKPDNVLVDASTQTPRARIVDFGLAMDIDPSQVHVASDLRTVDSTPEGRTTRHRAGTPAYMAPEQLDGGALGPAADQFAFFVSLFEALHGFRPFAGATMLAVREAIGEGRLRAGSRSVPRWLGSMIRRGLSVDPAARWLDMGVVAKRLRAALVRQSRRPWLVGVGVAALAIGAGVGAGAGAPDPCADAAVAVEAVAGPTPRAAFAAHLDALAPDTDPEYGGRTLASFDDWAARWRAGRLEACEAAESGALTRSQAEVRVACYEDRLASLQGLLESALRLPTDAPMVGAAITDAFGRLPSIADCDDTMMLRRREAWERAGPEEAQARAELRRALSRIRGALTLPPDETTNAALVEAIARADTLGYRPLQALAELLASGRAQHQGDYDASLEHAKRSLHHAVSSQDDVGAAEAALHAMWVSGELLRDPKAASESAALADAYIEALGNPASARVRWLDQQGVLDVAAGDVDAARARFEAALALREQDPSLRRTEFRTLFNLADTYRGDPERALELTERALEQMRPLVGSAHPNLAMAQSNRGSFLDRLGRKDEARRTLEHALELKENAYGPSHPALASTLSNLGHLVPPSEAVALYERGLSVLEPAVGPDSPRLGATVFNLGTAHHDLGQHAQARSHYERHLSLMVGAYGEAHPRALASKVAIAAERLHLGEVGPALDALEALAASVDGSADPYDRADLWTRLADARAADGDPDGGDEAYARAKRACADQAADCLPERQDWTPRAD